MMLEPQYDRLVRVRSSSAISPGSPIFGTSPSFKLYWHVWYRSFGTLRRYLCGLQLRPRRSSDYPTLHGFRVILCNLWPLSHRKYLRCLHLVFFFRVNPLQFIISLQIFRYKDYGPLTIVFPRNLELHVAMNLFHRQMVCITSHSTRHRFMKVIVAGKDSRNKIIHNPYQYILLFWSCAAPYEERAILQMQYSTQIVVGFCSGRLMTRDMP